MSRTYYTLAVFENGRWSPQFGDYDRATVVDEGRDSYSGRRKKIVRSGNTQAEIDDAITTLNSY